MISLLRTLLIFLLVASASAHLPAEDSDEPVKPLTAEEVVDGKTVGRATVEFLVAEVNELNIDSVFKPGVGHAQIIKAKLAGGKGDAEFIVVVMRDVATALLKSGITDVTGYFRGKQLRVTGKITRLERAPPEKTTYRLQVTRIEQLERVRKP